MAVTSAAMGTYGVDFTAHGRRVRVDGFLSASLAAWWESLAAEAAETGRPLPALPAVPPPPEPRQPRPVVRTGPAPKPIPKPPGHTLGDLLKLAAERLPAPVVTHARPLVRVLGAGRKVEDLSPAALGEALDTLRAQGMRDGAIQAKRKAFGQLLRLAPGEAQGIRPAPSAREGRGVDNPT